MSRKLKMILIMTVAIPVITGILLGYEMKDNCISDIPTVIVDHDHSEFSRMIAGYIEHDDTFDVVGYAQNDADVEDMIFNNEAYVGVIFPQDFYADALDGSAPNVLIIYDGTVMNVVSAARTSMSEILLTVKAGYMQNIFAGKLRDPSGKSIHEIQPIQANYKTLYNPTKNYRNFFLPGMLIALLQVGIAMVGLDRAKEEETGPLQDLRKIAVWSAMGALSVFLCLGIQVLFFGMPCRGSWPAFLVLTYLFSACQTTFGYMIGKIIYDRVFASQVTCVCVLPATILGGYTFPLMAMPEGFQLFAWLIPLSRYGNVVRELSLKDMTFADCLPEMCYLLVYLLIELACMTVFIRLAGALRAWLRAGDPARIAAKGGSGTLDTRVSESGRWKLQNAFDIGKNIIVVAVVPLMFTILFAGVYSHVYVENISLEVLDLDHTTMSRTLTENFEKSPGFEVVSYADTQTQLEDGLRTGRISAALVIPDGFGEGIKDRTSPTVLFLTDGTNIVIGGNAYAYAAKILNSMSAAVELQYLAAGGIAEQQGMDFLQTLNFTERVLFDPQSGYYLFVFAGFLTVFIQQTFMSAIGPILVQEKNAVRRLPGGFSERGFLRRLMKRILPYSVLSFVCSLESILGAHLAGGYPVNGSLLLLGLLQAVFLLGVMGVTLLLAACFADEADFAKFILFLSIPTLLTCGYVWPMFNMPPGFEIFIRGFWPMSYYALPAREILMKGAGIAQVWPDLLGAAIFAAVWLPIGLLAYKKQVLHISNKGIRAAAAKIIDRKRP